MKLEDLVIKFYKEEEPEGLMEDDRICFVGFRDEGAYVLPMDEDPVNLFEYTVLFAAGLVYTAALYRKMIPEKEEILRMAYRLADELREGGYESLKPVEDMNLEEFNDFMKGYDGRNEEE